MNELLSSEPVRLPPPLSILPASPNDVDWIDGLQRKHRDRVGWHPRMTLEGKIKLGQIIVARDEAGDRVGYCMASDRYMKREDCGILYQMNVEPGRQRALVGAALLHAQFSRSAYGCRLYCCWCAQDIAANRFWESMGFVPLAYRAGSEGRGRTHIFWQTRVREDDRVSPWWFPSQTQGGSMADRLVFPIPPGTHWSEAKPLILPGSEPAKRVEGPKVRRGKKKVEIAPAVVVPKKAGPMMGGLSFSPPPVVVETLPVVAEAPPRVKREKAKNDPRLVSAARELRDRYLDHVNASGVAQPVRKAIGVEWAGGEALAGATAGAVLLLDVETKRAA